MNEIPEGVKFEVDGEMLWILNLKNLLITIGALCMTFSRMHIHLMRDVLFVGMKIGNSQMHFF